MYLYQSIQLYPAQLQILANYSLSPPTDISWPAPIKQTIDFDIPNHFRRTSLLTNMFPIVMIRKRRFDTSKISIYDFFSSRISFSCNVYWNNKYHERVQQVRRPISLWIISQNAYIECNINPTWTEGEGICCIWYNPIKLSKNTWKLQILDLVLRWKSENGTLEYKSKQLETLKWIY